MAKVGIVTDSTNCLPAELIKQYDIRVAPGLHDSLGKERGKRKAMLKLVDLVNDHADTDKPLHVMVHYTDNIEEGKQLKETVTSRYNCTEVYMTDLTPVMTTHTGPAVALSFYS